MDTKPVRYDRVSIALHWSTAVLVVFLWIMAQIIDLFPSGPPRVGARSVHIVVGVILAVLLAARLLWRLTSGHHPEPVDPGLMGRVATLTHGLIYALLALVILAGLTNVWVRGDSVFGLFRLPGLGPESRWLRGLVGDVHALAANGILILAGLHAAAGLFHHFMLRDDTLRRMWPAQRG